MFRASIGVVGVLVAAGLASPVHGQLDTKSGKGELGSKLRSLPWNGEVLKPNRIARLNADGSIGAWVNVPGVDTGLPAGTSLVWDCYEPDVGDLDGDGSDINPIGGDDPAQCALSDPDTRWYFGTTYNQYYYVSDFSNAINPGGAVNRVNMGLNWTIDGNPSNATPLWVGLSVYEDYGQCGTGAPAFAGFTSGFIFDFGSVTHSVTGYYVLDMVLDVDLDGDGEVDTYLMPPDADGAMEIQIATAVDSGGAMTPPLGGASLMLWGTSDDEPGGCDRPGEQGAAQWDDDGGGGACAQDGSVCPEECYDYSFGLCPDPLGTMVAMWGQQAELFGVRGGSFVCPCGPILDPPVPVVKQSWKDKKGGVWTLTCTNASASGDFVWTYKGAAPGSREKIIGRCIYWGGRNCTGVERDSNGNDQYWWHYCLDPTPRDGKYRAVIDIFCKDICELVQIDMLWCDGEWMEVGRHITTAADFDAMSDFDGDGDTVPDEPFLHLLDPFYCFVGMPIPADFWMKIGLDTTPFNGTDAIVTLEAGGASGDINPGSSFFFDDFTMGDLISVHPSFLPLSTPLGLELVAQNPVPLQTGLEIARFYGSASERTTHWTLNDTTGLHFFANWFAAPNLGPVASDIEFRDLPGIRSTAGEIVIEPCAADMNGDGIVNGIDVGLFLQAYGTNNLAADMNGDGVLNGIDVGLFLQSYASCLS